MADNLVSVIEWIGGTSNLSVDFPWTCPFCGRDATISHEDRSEGGTTLARKNAHGPHSAISLFVVCPNPECKEFSLIVLLYEPKFVQGRGHVLKTSVPKSWWQLVPASDAKVYPEYVPKPIRDDYTEACLIRDLSPKASATLARRCLQGMIRDFYGIKKDNLYLEIEAIRDKVAPLTWDAISAVRGVGNIGAHMEKDINVIVDVESREAAMLTGLIEILMEDWYITRHECQQRLQGIVELGEAKKRAKNPSPAKDANEETG